MALMFYLTSATTEYLSGLLVSIVFSVLLTLPVQIWRSVCSFLFKRVRVAYDFLHEESFGTEIDKVSFITEKCANRNQLLGIALLVILTPISCTQA